MKRNEVPKSFWSHVDPDTLYSPRSVDVDSDENRAVIALETEDPDFPQIWIYDEKKDAAIRVDESFLVDCPIEKVIWAEDEKNIIYTTIYDESICNYLILDGPNGVASKEEEVGNQTSFIKSRLKLVRDLLDG